MRTTNLYPPTLYAEKIAEVIMSLFSSESDQSVKLFFDDKDFLSKDFEKPQDVDAIEDEPGEFDEMLEQKPEELDGLPEDNNKIKNPTDPIKVEEDESLDIEQER